MDGTLCKVFCGTSFIVKYGKIEVHSRGTRPYLAGANNAIRLNSLHPIQNRIEIESLDGCCLYNVSRVVLRKRDVTVFVAEDG